VLARSDLEALARALEQGARARPDGADTRRDRRGRRALGAYFTPLPLVEFVVSRTLSARLANPGLAWRDDGSPALRVLDPSAGDGRFLAAAADFLAEHARARGHDRDRARAAILSRCVAGMELDAEFAAMARARLPGATIHCCEALLRAPAEIRDVDIVIGNPPYLRSIHMARSHPALWTALQGRYAATSHGEWDLYAAFIEQALDWTAPGGLVGLVVPSRWFTAAFACKLREKLGRARAVRALIDFGAAQIFSGATTYAAVVFLGRARCDRVAVARRTEAGWQCGRVQAATLTALPWRLSVGSRRTLVDRLSRAAPALGEVARIAKGAGTNADRVYLLERARRHGLHGRHVRGWSRAAGDFVDIEATACRPCARGRDVRAFGQITGAVQCIVPYDPDGALWSAGRLAEHPRLAAYLAAHRDSLAARERGKYGDALYYRFGRPQNMAYLAEAMPKIVVPDVARAGRALLDDTGAMVLDSAYAIRLLPAARDHDLHVLLAVLNSPIVSFWLTETGVPLRGGYVRLKTAYLASLPLPRPGPATARLRALVARGCTGGSVDIAAVHDAVRCAYDIDSTTWQAMVATDADMDTAAGSAKRRGQAPVRSDQREPDQTAPDLTER
jgi:hypothetical protein